MPSRMRRPEDLRIPLNDDDWIVVKKHLTTGEQRASFTRMIKKMVAGEKVELDPAMSGISILIEYLLDWSILDADGKAVVIRGRPADEKIAAMNELPPEKYAEIEAAINAHIEAMAAAIGAEKNDQAGATASSATSVSVA